MSKYKMNKKSGTWDKIFGILLILMGLGFGYIECCIILAIRVIGMAVASLFGIEGVATTGVIVLTCIPAVGLIIIVGVITCGLFWTGYKLFSVGW